MTNLSSKSVPQWARPLGGFALIVAVCGVAGYGVGHLAAEVFPHALPAADVRWSDVLACLLAGGLIFGMIAVLITSLDARRLGRMYKLEGPASAEEIAVARFQALVMGFSGVILLLPMVFSLLGLSPVFGVAAIAVLFVAHTVMNWRVYQQADELLRRSVLETATIAFFLGQGLLFIWAAAERLGVATPLTAWDIYAVLMAIYLTASLAVSLRRGLA